MYVCMAEFLFPLLVEDAADAVDSNPSQIDVMCTYVRMLWTVQSCYGCNVM